MLTLEEMAERLDVSAATVKNWYHHGLLRGHRCDGRGRLVYEDPGDDPPVKAKGRKLALRRRFPQVQSNQLKEVQYEG